MANAGNSRRRTHIAQAALTGCGGRYPVEVTDVQQSDIAADVSVGARMEMTFRRLFTADGLHNYFWKARPVRGVTSD